MRNIDLLKIVSTLISSLWLGDGLSAIVASSRLRFLGLSNYQLGSWILSFRMRLFAGLKIFQNSSNIMFTRTFMSLVPLIQLSVIVILR